MSDPAEFPTNKFRAAA